MFGRKKALHKNNETSSQLESTLEEVSWLDGGFFSYRQLFFLTSIKDLKSTSVYLSSVWSDSVYLMNKKKIIF